MVPTCDHALVLPSLPVLSPVKGSLQVCWLFPCFQAGLQVGEFSHIAQVLDDIPALLTTPAPLPAPITLLRPDVEAVYTAAQRAGADIFAAVGAGDTVHPDSVLWEQFKEGWHWFIPFLPGKFHNPCQQSRYDPGRVNVAATSKDRLSFPKSGFSSVNRLKWPRQRCNR